MNIGEYLSSVADPTATVATVATVEPDGRWCVLRTAPASTLKLADALREAGFAAWTPIETQVRRLSRSRAHKTVTAPILPTFVFAQGNRIEELITLAGAQRKAQPSFSVFRYQDKFPIIEETSLSALRAAETKAALRVKRHKEGKRPKVDPLEPGEEVAIPMDSFAGMTGVVEESSGRFTLICFPGGRHSVKIETFHLRPDEANKGKPGRASPQKRSRA